MSDLGSLIKLEVTTRTVLLFLVPLAVGLIIVLPLGWITANAKASLDNGSNKIDMGKIPFQDSSRINSPYIREYSMPYGTWPNGILVAKNGIVWTVGAKSHSLISFDPKEGKIISEYLLNENASDRTQTLPSTPSGQANTPLMTWAMIQDNRDGSIWFSQADSPNPLWRFDPLNKKFEVIKNLKGAPYQMKQDDKTGDIWFTTYTDNKLGVVQKVEPLQTVTKPNPNNNNASINHIQYRLREFDLDRQSFPSGLYIEGSNSIWITQSLDGKLVHFRVVRDDNGMVINVVKVTEVPPLPSSVKPLSSNVVKKLFDGPYDIVVHGTDIWVTEHDANFITRYNLSTHKVTKFSTSTNPHQYLCLPFWLRETGNRQGLWFNEHYGNRIAFFNITYSTLTEYEIPTRNQSLGYIANALNIAVDPADSENKVWFSEYNHDKIGVLDRSIPIPFNIQFSTLNKEIVFNTTSLGKSQNQNQQQQQLQHQNGQPLIVNFKISKYSNLLINSSSSSSISKNGDVDNIVYFKASSSMSPYGLFSGNVSFSKNYIDLRKIKDNTVPQQAPIQLLVNQKNEPSSSPKPYEDNIYTISISATNGLVTKSIFLSSFVNK